MGLDNILGHIGLLLLRFANQREGLGGTGTHTESAADTPVQIQDCLLVIQMKGLHLAALDAGAAALACIRVEARQKGAGDEPSRLGIKLESPEHATAAATARAHKNGVLGVTRLEHKPGLLGPLDDRKGFLSADSPPPAIVNGDFCSHTKGHATLLWLVAALVHDALLLPADAIGHGKGRMVAYELLGPLMGHHRGLNADALIHRDCAHLGSLSPDLWPGEAGEVFFKVSDKLRAQLIDLGLPEAHDKLKGHVQGRLVLVLDPHNETLLVHLVQPLDGFFDGDLSTTGDDPSLLGDHRQVESKFSILGCEEPAQNTEFDSALGARKPCR